MRETLVMTTKKILASFLTAVAIAAYALCLAPACAAPAIEEQFPTTPDPFMGDWVGRWSEEEDIDPEIAAQVFPIGRDRYRINLVPKLDMRCPPLLVVEVERSGDSLSFKQGGISGEFRDGVCTGSRRAGGATFQMKKTERLSISLGEAPPQGAIVLYDGTNLDQWEAAEGWEILPDGTLMVTPDGKDLKSKATYKDVRMHIEFRTPLLPHARGQQRGNSGVFLQDAYEIQILDSYGLEGYYNECGALYKVAAPRVNACAPPLQWQTYDITYRAPIYDDDGTLRANPYMTVFHNGVLVHNYQEVPWRTDWKEKDRLRPPPTEPGPIRLQAHHNYIQFRNIWLFDLRDAQ